MSINRKIHDLVHDQPKYAWWLSLVHLSYLVTRKPYNETHFAKTDTILEEIKNIINYKE